MRETQSFPFEYKSPDYFRAGKCYLTVFPFGVNRESGLLVIMSEMGENPGPSVTNAVEAVATLALQTLETNPGRVIWIEHYPPDRGGLDFPESFDLVTFEWRLAGNNWEAYSPDWKRIDRETLKGITPLFEGFSISWNEL